MDTSTSQMGSYRARHQNCRPAARQITQRLIVVLMLALWSVSTLATTVAPPGTAHWQDTRYIERGFFDIALNGEHEWISPVVRKWVQPLKVWLYSEAGDALQQQWLLSAHLQQLSAITGLPVTFVSDRSTANVRILFVGDRDPNRAAARALSRNGYLQFKRNICVGQFRSNRRAEIVRGTVVIPVERAELLGKLVPCVIEEVTQMLGLLNDSRYFHPTIFSDITDNEQLTGFDVLLLKLLYLPELAAGMSYAEAAPIIRRQLETWRQAGVIERAASTVAIGPLHAFVTP
ncbi:MAG: DUF2927 domain-containing protein [Gammaproteobacteria bacterium]|nr:DUF2927 domain-containing protein [Gammaproteobacteria bacterium]